MSDVLLIPVTAVQPDLITQTDCVVYTPLASKKAHGIVKIGDGLDISNSGVLSLNTTYIDGIFSSLQKEIKDEVVAVDDKITAHMNDFNNPHRVTKAQVGLSLVDNTSDLDKPISTAARKELLRIENMISGARGALVYADYVEMVTALNADQEKMYGLGQSIFIGTRDVPDLWIYGVDDEYAEYSYIDDKTIETVLRYDGTIKIGYYVLAALESNEITLDNVVTTDTTQIITARKTFNADVVIKPSGNVELIINSNGLKYNGFDVATVNDIPEPISLENYYTKDETYSKIEIDDKLSDVEIDLSDYYTKEEVDDKIDSIEPEASVSVNLVWWEE